MAAWLALNLTQTSEMLPALKPVLSSYRCRYYNPKVPNLSLKIVPPFQVLFLGVIMWLVHRFIPVTHYHTGYNFIASRLLLYLCLGIFFAALYQFWRHQTTVNPRKLEQTSALITRGIFAWSRNPIYVVDALLLTAWAIWLGVWINLVLPLVFVWYVTRFQIIPEESMLLNKFGDDYRQYCSRARRWI